MKRRNFRIPTIIGVFVLVLGLVAGVYLVGIRQIFGPRAGGNNPPQNVRVSNITDSSFTATWTTQNQANCQLLQVNNSGNVTKTEEDEIKPANYTHSVTVQGLLPLKTYYYKIQCDGNQYDNNGSPWQTNTGSQIAPSQDTEIISGTVYKLNGDPAANALVYIQIAGAALASTVTSESSAWIVPVSSIRSSDLNSTFKIDEDNDVIEISIQAGPSGVSSAEIYLKSAKPVKPMLLGDVHDYKNLPPSSTDDIPGSDTQLPSDYSKESRFLLDDDDSGPPPTTVTLESLEDGETITTQSPSFFGEGPPGTEITVVVFSDPIEDTITIASNGNWTWSPSDGLDLGDHQISLSWRDENGTLQTLSRSFTVEAAELGPAYEATPSAGPDEIPTITPVATSTLTPVSSPSGTIPPQPDSGIPMPTLILFALGLGLLSTSGVIAYFAFTER